MLISFGFDISLRVAVDTTILYYLKVHPSHDSGQLCPEDFHIEPKTESEEFLDSFGNRCGRIHVPAGVVRFTDSGLYRDSGELDPYEPQTVQHEVYELPRETLQFLLPSRYCEADSELAGFAWDTFSKVPMGWGRVQEIVDFVHNHIQFDYLKARATRTAVDGYRERVGVCRDFTHLAITLCRCMNIPARYVTGYLGDIGIPPVPLPMDFSAWMEVYLGGKWYTFDPRHNERRIGRIVIARGRDASDVAITTVFGNHTLEKFHVFTDEVFD